MSGSQPSGPAITLPPYPYDRLDTLRATAAEIFGSAIDLSIGTPADPPPPALLEAMASSATERRYPKSVGSPEFRAAAASWLNSQFGAQVAAADVGATIGLKEFVAGVPHWLRLREPRRDTVLYPAVSYPSYEMGAQLAQCRAVAVPVDSSWRLRLDAIDPQDVLRALCLWVNSPGNPAGAVDDLDAAAQWGRRHGVPVLSDECYIEFTWNGRGRTILETGNEGVLAVHSLSKRSGMAGVRIGFYAGDPELVQWLSSIRTHAGFMAPGSAQAMAIAALSDQSHVEVQRERYLRRMHAVVDVLRNYGLTVELPQGGFYLWVQAPRGDAWALTEMLANDLGIIVSPGEFYGEAAGSHVRVAVVSSDDEVAELQRRAEQGAPT